MAFCFYGEPSLDPAFWSMVEWCGKNDVRLYSFTNLTQITSREIAKKLLDNLEEFVKDMENRKLSMIGCSGRTDKMLRKAVGLIKKKHRLS